MRVTVDGGLAVRAIWGWVHKAGVITKKVGFDIDALVRGQDQGSRTDGGVAARVVEHGDACCDVGYLGRLAIKEQGATTVVASVLEEFGDMQCRGIDERCLTNDADEREEDLLLRQRDTRSPGRGGSVSHTNSIVPGLRQHARFTNSNRS